METIGISPYTISLPEEKALKTARGWLLLGITALALAGLFAVLLVAARTPVVQQMIPFADFFHTALVVHVDLSVLVWLLACTCMLWSIATPYNCQCQGGIILSSLGMLLITLSPFVAEGHPLMNNYIPILQNIPFALGLSLFSAGIIYQLAISLVPAIRFDQKDFRKTGISPSTAQYFGITSTMIIAIVALVCFSLSASQLSVPEVRALFNAEDYFELLFWGGGHVLQFIYVQIMVVAWVWLASVIGKPLRIPPVLLIIFYLVNVLISLPALVIYYFYTITDYGYIHFFTLQMKHGGGVLALITGFFIAAVWFRSPCRKEDRHIRNALLFSVLLFAAGGILGFRITEINAVIPAHYHGSIVGVTLAMMGLSYHLLPTFGYGSTSGRLARMQPYFYGGGQLLHILGLAWSGGYGALRKTPGAMESAEGQIAMGFMGLGGLLSVIGGLFFVIVAARSVLYGKK